MSVNMPVHPWTSTEPQRPARLLTRLALVALAVSVVLVTLALIAPALDNQPPVQVTTSGQADDTDPVMVLNTACSPFAALSGCVSTPHTAPPA